MEGPGWVAPPADGVVPSNPYRDEYRQGNTMGPAAAMSVLSGEPYSDPMQSISLSDSNHSCGSQSIQFRVRYAKISINFV
jgi:hypothetical protein